VEVDLDVILTKSKRMMLIESPTVAMKEISGEIRSRIIYRIGRAVRRSKNPGETGVIKWV